MPTSLNIHQHHTGIWSRANFWSPASQLALYELGLWRVKQGHICPVSVTLDICVLIVLSEIISCVQLQGSIQDKRKTGKEQPQLPGSSVTYHCTCSRLNNQSNKITFIIRLCWTSEHAAMCSLQVEAQDSTWSFPQIHQFLPFWLNNEAENPAPQRSQVIFTASFKENYKDSSSFRTVALKFEPQQTHIIQVLSTLQWHPAVFRIDIQTSTGSAWVTLQTVSLRGLCLQLWLLLLLLYWGLLGAVGTKSPV